MAVRDTWHRALVYFGLAEDYDEEPELYEHEPETAAEGEGSTRSPRPARRAAASAIAPRRQDRAAAARRDRRHLRDDEPTAATGTGGLRPVGNGGADVQVHLVTPCSFNDAQEVADKFKQVRAGDPQPADDRLGPVASA